MDNIYICTLTCLSYGYVGVQCVEDPEIDVD